MGRLKSGTICSKHEKIKELAEEIESLVDLCLDDGQRMENGLDDKKRTIEDLQKENESLQEDVNKLTQEVDELKSYVKELQAEINELEGRLQ